MPPAFRLCAGALGPLMLADKLTSAMPQLGLTLHLLEEALSEEPSRWSAYIGALPDTYDTVLYFTPDELELLRGSPCFGESAPRHGKPGRAGRRAVRVLGVVLPPLLQGTLKGQHRVTLTTVYWALLCACQILWRT